MDGKFASLSEAKVKLYLFLRVKVMKNGSSIFLNGQNQIHNNSVSGHKKTSDITKRKKFDQNISVLIESSYQREFSVYRVNYYLENRWVHPLVVSLVKKITTDESQGEWVRQEYTVPARNKILVFSKVLSLESYISNGLQLFVVEVRYSKLLEIIQKMRN